MASPSPILLRLCLLLSILALSAAGRPCKTLFISSYSFSINRADAALDPSNPRSSSGGFVAIFAEIGPRKAPSSQIFFDRRFLPVHSHPRERAVRTSPDLFPSTPYEFSSLRERTRDILSVVVALLFGVGCGGLTAATMYLAWSVFFNRYDHGNAFEDSADEEEEEEFASDPEKLGKLGYEKIPEAPQAKEEA